MKAFILIVMINQGSPNASVDMERFNSKDACLSAGESITTQCEPIDIDGGQVPVCYTIPNIKTLCKPAR